MNWIQTLRRLGQQSMKGWFVSANQLNAQLPTIKKLYAKNGLLLVLTCEACPEQYDVFNGAEQVGYLRLRHGEFRVDFPDCGGETIYEAEPNGDGTFDANERLVYLTKAMRAILLRLNPQP